MNCDTSDKNIPHNDDDDPIIREIPIVHSKKLQNCLHLFQYPLKRKAEGADLKIQRCFYKPHNEEVKLEAELDTSSPNFDVGKAEIIAHEADGGKANAKQVYFENEIVDKVFLQSLKNIQNIHKYAVAAYNGSEIHLTTLKDIYQLRPVFPYLEKGLKKRREAEEKSDSEEEDAGPSSAQQVTVKFAQKQDERAAKRALDTNYRALMASRAEEPWKECTWHKQGSTFSDVERLRLVSDNLEDIGQAQQLTSSEYIRLLVPEDQEQAVTEPAQPSHIISLHSLRTLPVLEQCRLLLKDAQIIQFQQLQMLLAGGSVTEPILLKILPKVACLVRGNWVVKSDVLYPQKTFSATRGVPADLMCRTRDYVLYHFTKNQYVERKKVSSVMKIPAEEVKEILTGISKLGHNRGWELAMPPDMDFMHRHSELVQRENAAWQERFNQIAEFLRETNNERRQRRKSKSVSEDHGRGGRIHLNSISSDNESGTEMRSPMVDGARSGKGVRMGDGLQEVAA